LVPSGKAQRIPALLAERFQSNFVALEKTPYEVPEDPPKKIRRAVVSERDVERLWELMESISFCLLTNWDGRILHARPMGAVLRREENAIYFFTDARAHKDNEIAQYSQVCLGFADTSSQKYVSVSGTAEIMFDIDKMKELWTISAKAWWGSADNPDVRLLKITPQQAEFWDAPGNLVSNLRVAFSLMKGSPPNHTGEHQKVTFSN
jgi:general stress protein 26